MSVSSGRLLFDGNISAVRALIVVLQDARKTKRKYSFSGLQLERLTTSGLVLSGEIDDLKEKVLKLEGVVWSEY